MSRQQLKARAARAIFQRMHEADCRGDPLCGSYQEAGRAPVTGLQLIVLQDVERVGEDGALLVDKVQISAMAADLPRLRRDGLFIVGQQRYRVTVPLRNDGVVVTAVVVDA